MDSDNILSILQSLGQGQAPPPGADAPDVQSPGVPPPPQTNVMQAAAAPPPQPAAPDPSTQVATAAAAASPPMPKPRRSLLDTIGRISDVLATVGGAHALYQPTLDARQDRELALGDHGRKVDADTIALATSKFNLGKSQTDAANDERGRFANVLGAVNDPDDAANLPSMMQAAGLTDPKYAPFIAMVQKDPDQAKVLASALGGGEGEDFGKQIKTGYDSTGKRVAYVTDEEGNPHILNGVTPDETMKVVNTGDKNVIVGGTTGTVKRILPNSASPNTVLTTNTSRDNNIRTTDTQVKIAGMPARGKDGATTKAATDPQVAITALDDIQKGFADLHRMQALPGEGGALNQVEGAIGRTSMGQKVGEQFGSPAAQKRIELNKNINTLQSIMISSLPGSATRTKFEQEIQKARLPDPSKMTYGTATTVIAQLRQAYQRALASSTREAQAAPASTGGGLPVLTPEQAAKLPSGARFRTTDGRELVRH